MSYSCTTFSCLIALPIAAIPSLLWLLFFIFQDKHKEKAGNIIRVFLWGIAVALPVSIIQGSSVEFFMLFAAYTVAATLFGFLAVALVEEIGKYLVVKFKAMPFSFFNEPKDAMVYMITAALGFAAIENIIYALREVDNLQAMINITAGRGVSAVFLHVAASGVLGYFLALSLEHPKEKRKFLYTGIIAATLLHGIYNNFIMNLDALIKETGCSHLLGIASETGQRCTEEIFGIVLVAALLIISGIIIITGIHKLANERFG